MRFKNGWMALIAIALATALFGTTARATDYVWDGGGTAGVWTDPLNWNLNSGYPNSVYDKATINTGASAGLSGVTITVGELVLDNASSIGLGSSGHLKIDRGTSSPTKPGTMTVINNSLIDIGAAGTLEVLDNNANQVLGQNTNFPYYTIGLVSTSTFLISTGATLAPYGSSYGKIVGVGGKIQIDAGGTLTNYIIISGILTVEAIHPGTPTFLNGSTGVVHANLQGDITFGDNLELADEDGALWKASTSASAQLVFMHPATSLEGDFETQNNAKLYFALLCDEFTETSGTYTGNQGNILVDTGVCIIWDGGSVCGDECP
jgi:hypothetical protein